MWSVSIIYLTIVNVVLVMVLMLLWEGHPVIYWLLLLRIRSTAAPPAPIRDDLAYVINVPKTCRLNSKFPI